MTDLGEIIIQFFETTTKRAARASGCWLKHAAVSQSLSLMQQAYILDGLFVSGAMAIRRAITTFKVPVSAARRQEE